MKKYFSLVLWLAFCYVVNAQVITKELLYKVAISEAQGKIRNNYSDSLIKVLKDAKSLDKTFYLLSQLANNQQDLNISKTNRLTESEVHAAINPTDSANIIVSAMRWTPGFLGLNLTFPIYYSEDFGNSWEESTFDGTNELDLLNFVLGGGDPVLTFDADGTATIYWLLLTIGLDFEPKATLYWATSTDKGKTWVQAESTVDQASLLGIDDGGGRLVDKEWAATDIHSDTYKNTSYISYTEINLTDTTYSIFVKRRLPGKNNFEERVKVNPEEIAFAQFSSIDVGRDGKVHILFTGATYEDENFGLYYAYSEDGGKSFSTPFRISDFQLPCFPPGTVSDCIVEGIDPNRFYPCNHLVVDKSEGVFAGNLYAVWTANGTTSIQSSGTDIYFSSSSDNGKNWTDPIILNDDASDPTIHQYYPSTSVNNKGILAISWYDRRKDSKNINTHYFLTYSEDGGKTFKANTSVSSLATDFSQIGKENNDFGVGEYNQIITSSGFMIPCWGDGRSNDGNLDVYIAKIPITSSITPVHGELSTINSNFSVRSVNSRPSENLIKAELFFKKQASMEIYVVDLSGRRLELYKNDSFDAGDHVVELQTERLTPGFYVLVFATTLGTVSKSVLIK